MTNIGLISEDFLIKDLRKIINESKNLIVRNINSEMTLLYWKIGKRINDEILADKRAEYGEEVVLKLSKTLAAEFGRGFSRVSLIRMIQFNESFPDIKKSSTLSNQLSWSHIIELLPLKSQEQKEFYAYMSTREKWSVRQLRSNIHKMVYERTILTHTEKDIKYLELIDNNYLSPDFVLKDPYILDFLNLPDNHYENDLENSILANIEQFILELGTGFSFVARQKRITINDDHHYLDLLFYNRKLKRLVAVELKTGKFKAEYKGQMELYLSWLKKYECFEDEKAPIGIILCTERNYAQIELLDLSASNIHVAEYWTELPPLEVFEKKIQEIVLQSKKLYENNKSNGNKGFSELNQIENKDEDLDAE